MSPELFNSSGPEGITSGYQHTELVLNQPETDFGKVGRLAHSVHAAKGHYVWTVVGFGLLIKELGKIVLFIV